MTTVFNTIYSPDGEPIAGANVEVRLLWNKSVQAIAKDDANNRVILGRWATVTDADGEWSVDLLPTEDISPANTVYKIIERVRPGKETFIYYITVPAEDATPTPQWIGDLLTSTPSFA